MSKVTFHGDIYVYYIDYSDCLTVCVYSYSHKVLHVNHGQDLHINYTSIKLLRKENVRKMFSQLF